MFSLTISKIGSKILKNNLKIPVYELLYIWKRITLRKKISMAEMKEKLFQN